MSRRENVVDVVRAEDRPLGELDGVQFFYRRIPNCSLREIVASKGELPERLAGSFSSLQAAQNAVNSLLGFVQRSKDADEKLKAAKEKQALLEKAIKSQKAKDVKQRKAINAKAKEKRAQIAVKDED